MLVLVLVLVVVVVVVVVIEYRYDIDYGFDHDDETNGHGISAVHHWQQGSATTIKTVFVVARIFGCDSEIDNDNDNDNDNESMDPFFCVCSRVWSKGLI